MLRSTALFLFLATFACAQIQELATTDDGSVVHFATPMRLRGTNEGPQGKIFKWDGAIHPVVVPNVTPLGFRSASAYGPVISGDGSAYGYSFSCGLGVCGEYVYKGTKVTAGGRAFLSRNGRWGLRGWGGKGSGAYRLDLETGELVEQPRPVFGLTDSGEVLTAQGNSLYLGERLVATAPGKILDTAMSADGTRVVYVTQHDGLLDLREGDVVLVSMSDAQTGLRAELSSDGSRMLVIETILDTKRAFWMDRYLPERHDLGIVQHGWPAISGDGRIVWLVSDDGRLTKVTLDSGDREVFTEAVPARLTISGAPVRGSLNRIEGPGLGDGPWNVTLVSQTDRVRLPMTVLESKADHVDFQIPWQLSDVHRYNWMGVGRPDGTFEQVLDLLVTAPTPQFWSEPFRVSFARITFSLIKAVHQNWDGLVTISNPARPGELVHVYMSGLGPVVPVQNDNVPAPAPPPTLAGSFSCSSNGQNAPVLFVGLSAGTVGVYQVDVEIPRSGWGPLLNCTLSSTANADTAVGYLPIVP